MALSHPLICVIIGVFMEDIYYEGSNFWRNHASFKDTRKLAYYAKRWF